MFYYDYLTSIRTIDHAFEKLVNFLIVLSPVPKFDTISINDNKG